MVVYFTGTGNSKFLAEVIANELKDEIVNATEHIQKEIFPTLESDKPYVVVSPTYAWRLPHLFEEWIRKCEFLGSKKVYFVLNCGSEIGAASKYAKPLCDEKGFEYMGMAEIVMPENYIALFSAPSEAESQIQIQNAKEKAIEFATFIAAGKPFEQVKISPVGHLCSGIVNTLFYKFCVKADKFWVKDSCISCGQCAKKCMLNNISMKDGKPVWGKDCTHCMACICSCPTDAIECGKHTVGLRRYTFERQTQHKEL